MKKGRPKGIKNKKQHIWTEEEKEYLREIVSKRSHKQIQIMMNKKFEYQFDLTQISGAIKRYKLKTGLTGYFTKGDIPFNKGKKQREYMSEESIEKTKFTRFKLGQSPVNWRPIGSERVTVDGYTEIKIKEPNIWKLKQRLIYEKAYGEIPYGYTVVFADRDKKNFNIDNLILVSRNELLKMNSNDLIKEDAELTKTGKIVADLYIKLEEIKHGK